MGSIKMKLVNSPLGVVLRLLREMFPEFCFIKNHSLDYKTYKNCDKLRVALLIRLHAVEKGMSIGNVRIGFGQPKVLSLLKELDLYLSKSNDLKFASEAFTIISRYIEFNNFESDNIIVSYFATLKDKYPHKYVSYGGILYKRIEDIKDTLNKDFAIFSQSRFSVRDYSNTPIDLSAIERALKLCERTPSACNRQNWKIYVYKEKELKDRVFEFQGGCKGFSDDMQVAIVVCGDSCGYSIEESNLLYVDGGLYAMNLLYSLHYEGLAAIPLTMGKRRKCIELMKKELSIREQDVPCIVIGVGTYKDNYKVAESHRFPFSNYTTLK